MAVIVSVVIGYVLDMIIGTPKVIKKARNFFYACVKKLYSKINSRVKVLVTIALPILFGIVVFKAVEFIADYNMIFSIVAESIICYFCISCREIKDNSERVHKALKRGYIKKATKLFNTITENGEITEPREIAENIIVMIMDGSIDRVIAPIFYILVFGSAGGVVYRVLSLISDSTRELTARVFKNLAEFIPTRLALVFMFISAKLLKMDCRNAYKVFKRDRYKLKSLNRGLIMSLCAGSLNVELSFKKQGVDIGDSNKIITHNDIKIVFEMINISSLLALITFVAVRILFVLLMF